MLSYIQVPKYFKRVFTMSHIFIFQSLSKQNQENISFATMINFAFRLVTSNYESMIYL